MINLLSPEIKKARRFAKLNVTLVQYTIIIAIAILAMSSLMVFGQYTLNNTKTSLKESIATNTVRAATLEPISKDAEELSATIDTIGTLLDQEVKFSYVLQEIGSIIPSGVVLSAISLSQDTSKPMVLEVNLITAERAGVFQQNLIESELFVGADILNVSQGVLPGYSFTGQIQAYFNPDVPLNSLDDPVETTTETVVEETPAETVEETAEDSETVPATDDEQTETESDEEETGGGSQ